VTRHSFLIQKRRELTLGQLVSAPSGSQPAGARTPAPAQTPAGENTCWGWGNKPLLKNLKEARLIIHFSSFSLIILVKVLLLARRHRKIWTLDRTEIFHIKGGETCFTPLSYIAYKDCTEYLPYEFNYHIMASFFIYKL
jgi:hypothetical protein